MQGPGVGRSVQILHGAAHGDRREVQRIGRLVLGHRADF